MSQFYIFDLETFYNCFLYVGKFVDSEKVDVFEISARRNDRDSLLAHLTYLQSLGNVLHVGYNNIGFDYPIIHEIMTNPYTFNYLRGYNLGQEIIKGQRPNFMRVKDRYIPQLDLMKLNHFDNKAKRTRLKDLQFAMRSASVDDLPYDPHSDLTPEQMDKLIEYGCHDVTETEQFLLKCIPLIEMRQDLLSQGVLFGDVLNWSDVKLGTEYLTTKIGRSKCYKGREPIQSFRSKIFFKDIIFPKIKYRNEEFDKVRQWFSEQSIQVEGGGERPKLEIGLAGLNFHFGLGGVHASVENKNYHSNDEWVIKDIDVSGMYVAVAIANGLHPEHLGEDFNVAYKQLQRDRAQYPKGTTMNKVLKLAGNGVYGNSNNPYSCFYDPKYTFSVTVNGQLQLLQLAEVLSLIPGLQLIQANTDGITAYLPRKQEPLFNLWKDDWESKTGLTLEEVEYSRMFIRDVNSYLAVTKDGKVKAKGAYWYPKRDDDYEGNWHKDHSMMVVQKATEACLIHGWSAEDVVRSMTNPFDFMLRYKLTGSSRLYIGDEPQQRTVRYYVSTEGQPMKKVSEPKGEVGQFKRKNKLSDAFFTRVMNEIGKDVWDDRIHTKNKSKYETVVTGIESGKLVKECNRAKDFNWNDVDYNYYVSEVKKLLLGVNCV